MVKSLKDRDKALQEKHQAILLSLLRDEDNKYCADCHAKGPRWASWNLGIFMCIRCAGIHRNLGVHISRVKSVNLDSWTPEQMFMVQEVGNSRAMAVYEANVPDGFRRPQTDSALELFIRDKYERKRYIAREWIPPKPPAKAQEAMADEKKPKKSSSKSGKTQTVQLSNVRRPKSTAASDGVLSGLGAPSKTPVAPATKSASSADLLGLTVESSASTNNTTAPPAVESDPFSDFLSADTPSASAQQTVPQSSSANDKPSDDLNDTSLLNDTSKSTKDSIMALFASGAGNQQQQFYGVPGGMYMGHHGQPAPTGQQQVSNAYLMNGSMMTPHAGMMTSPMPGMMTPQQGLVSSQQPCMMTTSQGGMTSQQGLMSSQQPGMMSTSQGGMTSQPGMMTSQQGLMSSQQGLMPSQQPGMMSTSQGVLMTSQPGMMTSPMPGMMTSQGLMPSPMPGMGGYQGHQLQGGMMPNRVSQMPGGMMMMGGQAPSVGQATPAMIHQHQQQQQQMMMMGHQPVNMMNAQHFQQVQQQMASMRLASPAQTMVPQQGTISAGSGWGGAQVGNTLSTNLWQ